MCDQYITYLFVDQLLMVLHKQVFFVSWAFSLLSCQIYVLHTNESKNVKKSRKNCNLNHFLSITCGPPGNRFSTSTISNFKFVNVFDQFYQFRENRSLAVLDAVWIFQSLSDTGRQSSQHCGVQIKLSKNPLLSFFSSQFPTAAAASSYAAERIAAATGGTSPSIRCGTHSKPSLSPKPGARFGPVTLRAKLSEASGFIPAFRFPLPDRLWLPAFSACFGCGVAFRPLFHL
jgi:hypothetical protein